MESAMDALLEKFKSHAFTYGVAAMSDAGELRAGAA